MFGEAVVDSVRIVNHDARDPAVAHLAGPPRGGRAGVAEPRTGSRPTSGSPPASSSRTSSPASPAGPSWSRRAWPGWRRCWCCTTPPGSARPGRPGGSRPATRSTTTSGPSPAAPASPSGSTSSSTGTRRSWPPSAATCCRCTPRPAPPPARMAMRPVPAPFDVVVTTNAGFPLDQNLYQSVKGMSAAFQVTRPGGVIVCAAECRDGFPDHGSYREVLASASSPAGAAGRDRRPRRHRARPVAGADPGPHPVGLPGGHAHLLPQRRRPGRPPTWSRPTTSRPRSPRPWPRPAPAPGSASSPRARRPFPTWSRADPDRPVRSRFEPSGPLARV